VEQQHGPSPDDPFGNMFREGDALRSGPAADPAGPYPGAPAVAPVEPARTSRRGVWWAVLAAGLALVVAAAGASWFVLTRPDPADAAQAYAEAWQSGDYAALGPLSTGEQDPQAAHAEAAENLGVESTAITLGEVEADGDTARAPFTAALELSEAGEWSYDGELELLRDDGEWRVDFSAAVIHPELGDGQTLVRANEWEERGQILAADGTRLDTEDASASIAMMTGEVTPAEEEDLEDLGPAYAEGDPVGRSGIQAAYQDRLAGTPAVSIRAVPAGAADEQDDEDADDPDDADDEGEDEVHEVARLDGEDGQDVTTTLDLGVQSAAAQAIGGQEEPTALVAVRPSTGEILASVNAPAGFDRAFEGQYPAGSSFKIITYEALLNSGMGMDAAMNCPETVEVGGLDFRNAGDAEYGAQSVTEAFATSCNTALVQEVAERLDAATLTAAAEEFGFNDDLTIGLPTFSPQYPSPDGLSLLAQASIGQGQMLTSPLHMATVPAAVADGHWRSPVLIADPELEDQPEPHAVGHAEELRSMMREVVTDGTASDAGLPGEAHGKTGSAEFGTAEDDEELESHAWFVGFDPGRDLAFSVVVEGGGGGGDVAAPLAAAFLNGL
jgi:hypothetical protein